LAKESVTNLLKKNEERKAGVGPSKQMSQIRGIVLIRGGINQPVQHQKKLQ